MIELDFAPLVRADRDDEGFPVAQPDVFCEPGSGAQPCELFHFWGHFGYPHDGVTDGSGEVDPQQTSRCLYGWGNDVGHAFALSDPRVVPKLPAVGQGVSGCYGGKLDAPSVAYFDEHGSYRITVPYAGGSAKACTITVNVGAAGAESIEIAHGDGPTVLVTASGIAMGTPPEAIPVAKAPPLLEYLDEVVKAVKAVASVTMPPATAAVAAILDGPAATDARSRISATLTNAT
jgi:hypothetical protein